MIFFSFHYLSPETEMLRRVIGILLSASLSLSLSLSLPLSPSLASRSPVHRQSSSLAGEGCILMRDQKGARERERSEKRVLLVFCCKSRFLAVSLALPVVPVSPVCERERERESVSCRRNSETSGRKTEGGRKRVWRKGASAAAAAAAGCTGTSLPATLHA